MSPSMIQENKDRNPGHRDSRRSGDEVAQHDPGEQGSKLVRDLKAIGYPFESPSMIQENKDRNLKTGVSANVGSRVAQHDPGEQGSKLMVKEHRPTQTQSRPA